jgi:hypothetical protein
MRAIHLGNYFIAECIAFSLRRVGSEFASDRFSSSSLFVSSDHDRLGFELAARFFTEQAAQDFRS